jgi:hypothetical protein
VVDSTTRSLVIARAANRCEYCQIPQAASEAKLHVEHILATQHLKDDSLDNLALSCPRCNFKKGPNLSGIDPLTRTVVQLFHPRHDRWSDHFKWEGPLLLSSTPTGRATIALLDLNVGDRIRLRQQIIGEGEFQFI